VAATEGAGAATLAARIAPDTRIAPDRSARRALKRRRQRSE
jgi:hypothetical protein